MQRVQDLSKRIGDVTASRGAVATISQTNEVRKLIDQLDQELKRNRKVIAGYAINQLRAVPVDMAMTKYIQQDTRLRHSYTLSPPADWDNPLLVVLRMMPLRMTAMDVLPYTGSNEDHHYRCKGIGLLSRDSTMCVTYYAAISNVYTVTYCKTNDIWYPQNIDMFGRMPPRKLRTP